MEIRRISEPEAVVAASHLFDDAPEPEATERFLASSTHHLLIAYVDEEPAGMVTGVETTHPDKGTEMFLYELGVAPAFRRRGIGTSLVSALAELARSRGCYGMWVATGEANAAALATYARAEGEQEPGQVVLSWTFPGPG
ncbi:GNAT family N-acetyltransferase [Streptomyces sp. NPDC004647]|uniref:GNAT family N-acetyltransferase n=1 Tax=Streptomyces sp. NPDC004647 TaxID=3154671 RepID=UPI0033A47E93